MTMLEDSSILGQSKWGKTVQSKVNSVSSESTLPTDTDTAQWGSIARPEVLSEDL